MYSEQITYICIWATSIKARTQLTTSVIVGTLLTCWAWNISVSLRYLLLSGSDIRFLGTTGPELEPDSKKQPDIQPSRTGTGYPVHPYR